MKKEKSNKLILDKKVTLIVSIIVLVVAVAVIWELIYRLAGRINIRDSSNKTSQSDATYIPYNDIFEDKHLFNIYNISYNEGSYLVMGYNKKMYYVESITMNDIFSCATEFTTNGVGKRITLNGKIYSCIGEDEETDYGANIIELDINPNKIDKVIVYSYPLSTDTQYSMYFIYKDGVVDYYHADGSEGTLTKNAFEDNKIANITQKCLKQANIGCKKTELTLTLKNGATKKITNFNFE